MFPKIYNSSGDLLAVLDNIKKETASIIRRINGRFTFQFEAREQELKSEYFDPDNNVIIANQTFDIKYIEQMHQNSIIYAIQCEHAIYRLQDGESNILASYANTGTPTSILTDILSGTEFSVGTIDFTDPITISVNKEVTRKELITLFANQLGGELEYTAKGFTINILDTIGQNNNFEIRFGKNLIGLSKIIDKRGELITSYQVDIIELKNSNTYIEKGYQVLEQIGVGDTVRIIDEVIGLDILNRIVQIEYNPVFEKNTFLEIANTIKLITDDINEIATTAVIQEKLYNNVSISAEEGFVSTRSDNKTKTIVNATDGFVIQSDTGSGLQDNFKVDTNGKIQAKEIVIDGSGEFKGSITAGTIDIGSGTFTVDASGNCIANSLTIGGGSGISNLTDAGALATKDNVDMSTSEVLNKIADNITETITRKWAAESGADVTLNNTAAGFTGQGDLSILDSISETYIDSDAVTTPKIAAGAVIASKIAVGQLSAISANIGEVTAGIITGLTFRTATSGKRIEISGDDLNTYNSSNQKEGVQIESTDDYNELKFYEAGSRICTFGFSAGIGAVIDSTEDIVLSANTDLIVDATDDIRLDAGDDIILDNITTNFTMNRGTSDITMSADEVRMTLSNDWDLQVNGNSLIYNISTQNLSFQIVGGNLEVFNNGVYQESYAPI